ncbi:hypothetical protein CYMTET_48125 [Cymbomonas tetramitiformis]|uniref:N-acetylglucosaminylphosphatidylinositol deacetylase n=1 Tax=Cymbomonas tetramitiformis TaxID=36881 RepID=A0AAE0EW19_9CHLO|nr:hypothetical protein CYMTET_48125 [Cymbomonas tetramitiformis]
MVQIPLWATIWTFSAAVVPLAALLCLPLRRYLCRYVTDNDHVASWRRVALITAHPDDESMFFAPTIVSLIAAGLPVHILCLSTGDADGLGKVRSKEFELACRALKVKEEHIAVIDDQRLPDGLSTIWPLTVVQEHVRTFIQAHQIDTVITFDKSGVSGHNNHIAAHRAVERLIQQNETLEQPGSTVEGGNRTPLRAWQLITVPFVRKYLGTLDIIWSIMQMNIFGGICFISPNADMSLNAMRLHASQWVWYRRLFVRFARYSYVNTLHEIVC